MKKYIISILCACILAFASHASAEGGCPDGYFLVRSGSVTGCAPIPGYGNQQKQQAPAQRAEGWGTPQWRSTWGAIVINADTNSFGLSLREVSQLAAEHSAIAMCRKKGGGDGCMIELSYNDCAAMVRGQKDGQKLYYTASAPSIKQAREIGMKSCKSNKSSDCVVAFDACNTPSVGY